MIARTAMKISAVAALLLAGTAHAASWVEIDNPSMAGFQVGAKTVTYGAIAADEVFVLDGANPPGGQSPSSIGSLVTSQFGLPSSGTGSITLSSSADLSGAKSGSFTVAGAFNYLAIHYGNGELLFHWDQTLASGTTFSFGNLPRGISNYRAFDAVPGVSAVPEPASYALMAGGLALIGFIGRRRRSAAGK